LLADAMPWNQLPSTVRRLTRSLPLPKPLFPDPGTPLQLVHHDDVASAVALAATTTSAPAGAYNIAGDGLLSMSEIADALGARPIKVPRAAAIAASKMVSWLPLMPSALEWLHAGRTSVVMDVSKAKEQLRWQPKYTAAETLSALAGSVD
jgi:nucleoside-diphosphate-sugar epimerase